MTTICLYAQKPISSKKFKEQQDTWLFMTKWQNLRDSGVISVMSCLLHAHSRRHPSPKPSRLFPVGMNGCYTISCRELHVWRRNAGRCVDLTISAVVMKKQFKSVCITLKRPQSTLTPNIWRLVLQTEVLRQSSWVLLPSGCSLNRTKLLSGAPCLRWSAS